jgi:uncharacterized protein (TIGR02145 family)
MNLFTRQGRTLLLSAVAAIVASIFTSGAFAQDTDAGTDTAYVPFLVNVDAAVKAEPADGAASDAAPVQISVRGGTESFIRLPLQKTISVLYGAQKHANHSAIIISRGGKVTLNLPAQSYKNAVVALYSVDGKRILRKTVSASNVASNISRRNLANGAYILSVKGTGRDAVTSRLTHSGGGLDIKIAFGGENRSTAEKLTKKAAAGEWIITVSAAEHFDSSYAISPKAGMNATQTITLREAPVDGHEVIVSSAGTGSTGGGSYAVGATVSITPGTAPEGYVFVNWISTSNGVAFADANSETTTFTMPENSVTVRANFDWPFKTVVIGEKRWMAENLNVQTESGSWCYGNSADSCNKYGRLYDWATAKTVCPTGWHLPSRQEWDHLAESVGGTKASYYDDWHDWLKAGKALKSQSGWNNNRNGTDTYGFSALPGGYRNDDGIFSNAGDYGAWWTATEYDSDSAYGRGMYYFDDRVGEGSSNKGYGSSVRCVKD